MIQVTKVWWDGEKLMAEPIDPTTIYQEPAQEKDWGAVGDAHIAAIKKSSKAMVEDAVVRAVHKVMAEFEAKSDERLMKDWGPGPHEYHSLPAQQEPVAMKFKIYKPTVPDPTRQDINNALLPWVHDQDRSSGFDASMWVTPVATLPPQRKPLTEEEIDALVIDKDGLPNSHLEFARAIEAAHGIKENT